MINEEELSKEVERALGEQVAKSVVKGNGTRLGNITLAVELDNVVESLQTRIRHLETIKSAVLQLKDTL